MAAAAAAAAGTASEQVGCSLADCRALAPRWRGKEAGLWLGVQIRVGWG